MKVNTHKPINSGGYGSYHKVNKTQGIKVLGDCFETIAELKSSCDWDDAKAEAYALRRAWKSGVVAKCFGVRVVWCPKSKGYAVGILMQDLGLIDASVMGEKHGLSEDEFRAISIRLRKALLAFGIEHNDLHEYNVMFYKGKYYAIDFGPNDVSTFKVRTPVKNINDKKASRSNKSKQLQAA